MWRLNRSVVEEVVILGAVALLSRTGRLDTRLRNAILRSFACRDAMSAEGHHVSYRAKI